MGSIAVSSPVREGRLKAVVLNADGTVKRDLGTVGYYHHNPIRRWIGSFIVGLISSRKIRHLNGECSN